MFVFHHDLAPLVLLPAPSGSAFIFQNYDGNTSCSREALNDNIIFLKLKISELQHKLCLYGSEKTCHSDDQALCGIMMKKRDSYR